MSRLHLFSVWFMIFSFSNISRLCHANTLRSIRPTSGVSVRFSIMDVGPTPADPYENNYAGSYLYEMQTTVGRELNYSVVYFHNVESGYPDAHGNYSGVIGLLQRDEADVSSFGSRPDASEYEPVIFGPALISSEAVILTVPLASTNARVSVTDVFYSMDAVTYAYTVIVLFICNILIVVLSHGNCRVWRRKRNLKRLVRKFRKCMWSLFEMMVGQENGSFVHYSQRILWSSTCISMFILVPGYLLNLMSTDLIAEIPSSTIDNLHDLLSPQFYPQPSAIMKNYPTYNILEKAKRNSTIGRLYAKLLDQDKKYLVDFDHSKFSFTEMQTYNAFTDLLLAGEASLILEYQILTSLEYSACASAPEMVSRSHVSSSFVESTLNMILNKNIDHVVRRYLERRSNIIMQSGIYWQIALKYLLGFNNQNGLSTGWDFTKCIYDIRDSDEKTEFQMPLSSVFNVFRLFGLAIIVSSLVFVFEKIVPKCFR